jgi:hypothetical protein
MPDINGKGSLIAKIALPPENAWVILAAYNAKHGDLATRAARRSR